MFCMLIRWICVIAWLRHGLDVLAFEMSIVANLLVIAVDLGLFGATVIVRTVFVVGWLVGSRVMRKPWEKYA